MLRKCGIVIAGLSVLFPATIAAQTITNGESLKQRCATFQLIMPSAGLGCRGYIGAVADILIDGNTIYDYRACSLSGEKRETLVKIVYLWLDNHQEALKQRASAVTAQALAEAFPCGTE